MNSGMENKGVIGYKVFYPDWTCQGGFQYEVGKTYEMDEKPECCSRGFHFCRKLADCFNYYMFNPSNKVAKVIALGEIDEENDDSKCCTNRIQIIEELSWEEVLKRVNTGEGNAGLGNSGDYNSGDCNSGDFNKTDHSNGCFNMKEPKIYLFDKPSEWTYNNWLFSDARDILCQIPEPVNWILSNDMTDEERLQHPEYEATGGYLKELSEADLSEKRQRWWDKLADEYKECIKSIPNFDAKIFKEITGIDINKGN